MSIRRGAKRSIQNESCHIMASLNVTIQMSNTRAPGKTVSRITTNNLSNKDTLIKHLHVFTLSYKASEI